MWIRLRSRSCPYFSVSPPEQLHMQIDGRQIESEREEKEEKVGHLCQSRCVS